MTDVAKTGVTRRTVLAGAAAGTALLSMPSIVRAQDKSLKVGVYGGYFQESFDQHIFPDFTQATGIEIESISEPTGEAWLVQLSQAAKAKQAPADVSMMSQVAMLKGQAIDLWKPLDLAKLPNTRNLLPQFVNKYPDGRIAGIGAVSGDIQPAPKTELLPEPPHSGHRLGDP